MKLSLKHFVVVLAAVTAISYLGVRLGEAQSGGLRRESGVIFSRGNFVELACGGTISANDALYLDTNGAVQRAATSGQTTTLIGIANAACISGGNTQVQISGTATVVADATISIGDRVGAPTSTAGRVMTVASTLAIASGGTTVTSSAANGSIVTGDPGTSRILGRALTSGTVGQSITILLTLG